MGWSQVRPLSLVCLALKNILIIKVSQNCFFWARNRMVQHISKCFFFPSPCDKHEGIFLWYSTWRPVRIPGGKIYKSPGGPLWLDAPVVFLSQACPHKASRSVSMKNKVFQSWYLVSVPLSHDSWYSSVSRILGAEVCRDLILLTHLVKIVVVVVFSSVSLLIFIRMERWLPIYVPDWKLEFLANFLKSNFVVS